MNKGQTNWEGQYYYRIGRNGGMPSWRNRNTGEVINAPKSASLRQLKNITPKKIEPTNASFYGPNPVSKEQAMRDIIRSRELRKR